MTCGAIPNADMPLAADRRRSCQVNGAIGAPAALCNAIEDALIPFGVRITEQYLPPSRILELIATIDRDERGTG